MVCSWYIMSEFSDDWGNLFINITFSLSWQIILPRSLREEIKKETDAIEIDHYTFQEKPLYQVREDVIAQQEISKLRSIVTFIPVSFIHL